ncbi:hypothetical protein G3T36_08695 [Diaminobutyricibacter tongyongensis]|uniref:Uncharacterized protein n=1 Tax=Leifsonia tongyongensis TaxID=1268043 RepID=A0A6L9XWY7_9MICO|nr:hypothetical protein [Diaminobutyricibacter tongyongensis]NEN05951.1 hypothetical protein [Diaminobutyricibacter tongyongensis]
MSRSTGAPVAGAHEEAASQPIPFTTDARRALQLALAALWLLDGLLQLQPFMFTPAFATQVLAAAANGNPGWLASPIRWASGIVEHEPVLINTGFAALQLAIGLGIAWRRSVKPALAVSIVWSLLVWWFGEGLGGLFSGGADPLTGAPGAVVLYAVLGVLLWPTQKPTTCDFVATQPVGPVAARVVWAVLWGGLALLALVRGPLAPAGLVTLGLVAGSAILAVIAVAVFLPVSAMRVGVILALVASAWIWVVGESLGDPGGGMSTDPDSGPLLALIALAYWPSRSDP